MAKKAAYIQVIEDSIEEIRAQMEEIGQYMGGNGRELQTRYWLIDPILKSLGWDIGKPEQVWIEYPTNGLFADYAFFMRGANVPVMVAEAKAAQDWELTIHEFDGDDDDVEDEYDEELISLRMLLTAMGRRRIKAAWADRKGRQSLLRSLLGSRRYKALWDDKEERQELLQWVDGKGGIEDLSTDGEGREELLQWVNGKCEFYDEEQDSEQWDEETYQLEQSLREWRSGEVDQLRNQTKGLTAGYGVLTSGATWTIFDLSKRGNTRAANTFVRQTRIHHFSILFSPIDECVEALRKLHRRNVGNLL